jgi:hypothetical protein
MSVGILVEISDRPRQFGLSLSSACRSCCSDIRNESGERNIPFLQDA